MSLPSEPTLLATVKTPALPTGTWPLSMFPSPEPASSIRLNLSQILSLSLLSAHEQSRRPCHTGNSAADSIRACAWNLWQEIETSEPSVKSQSLGQHSTLTEEPFLLWLPVQMEAIFL